MTEVLLRGSRGESFPYSFPYTLQYSFKYAQFQAVFILIEQNYKTFPYILTKSTELQKFCITKHLLFTIYILEDKLSCKNTVWPENLTGIKFDEIASKLHNKNDGF